MINWNAEKFLIDGEMTFEKVQIREVSSHYRNGSLFLAIFPKLPQNGQVLKKEEGESILIDSQEIKPLVIEKLVVRAKKLKYKMKRKIKSKNEENRSEELSI